MVLHISSEDDMKLLGEKLGGLLVGGECIELVGDVGSGKTTITKGIAKGLGITEVIQSPTFTINRTYESPGGVYLSHYDFYRLADPGIMADELLETLSDSQTAIVIEWGDIVQAIVPDDRIKITFSSPTESTRDVVITAVGEKANAIMEKLHDFTT